VFEQAKTKHSQAQGQILDPKLVEILGNFKAKWVDELKLTPFRQKSESLLLSAIDQVLGFTDRSMMHPVNDHEKKEFDDAEKLLMPLIRKKVEEYQRSNLLVRQGGGLHAQS